MVLINNSLIYDGECPFCKSYVKFMRLQDSIGPVDLVDARVESQIVNLARSKGFDFDVGMVLYFDGKFYHGDACMYYLSTLTEPKSKFSVMQKIFFGSPGRAKVLYPVFRLFRNLVLRMLGREKINYY